MILSEQVLRVKELMGLLNEQEGPRPGDDTSIIPVAIGPELEERFTPIKGEEFTGLGKYNMNEEHRHRNRLALEEAQKDAIKKIFEKIGGTVVNQPSFLGDITVKWEDGEEDTFPFHKYIEEPNVVSNEKGHVTGEKGEIWVNRKTGAEVKAPNWINKERIRNPFRAMKRDRFLKKHEMIETTTVTYKVK